MELLIIRSSLILLTAFIISCTVGNSQKLDNKNIVDQSLIEFISDNRLKTLKSDVVNNVLKLQEKTKIYVGAKLKQNLFKALRVLAEKELHALANAGGNHPKFSRQEEDPDDDDDTDESTTIATTTTAKSDASTTAKSTNIAPVVATFVKAIFGGHNAVNLTSYVQGATRFLPQAVGNQILGVVRLIASNPNHNKIKETTIAVSTTTTTTSTTTTTTKRPNKPRRRRKTTTTPEPVTSATEVQAEAIGNEATTLQYAQEVASTLSSDFANNTVYNTTAKVPEEDEEEEEEIDAQVSPFARQLKLPDFNDGLNFLGALVLGVTPKSSGGRRRGNATTTESPSGFEEEPEKKEGLDLTGLATGIRMGLGDLVKVVPDLFKGAREAVGLLSGIQSLLSGFGVGG